jgi:hypothetical protein
VRNEGVRIARVLRELRIWYLSGASLVDLLSPLVDIIPVVHISWTPNFCTAELLHCILPLQRLHSYFIMAAEDLITLRYLDRIAIITFNRPDKLNALNADLYYLLGERLREIEKRDDIFITILTGTGRYFSA